MSKNTGDTRFRKVDVDNIGQSNFEEEKVDDTHLNPRDVENLLNSGKYEDAVRMVLDNAPVNSKDMALKDAVLALILRGMSQLKSTQIDSFVGGLNQDQLDMLMKYIYRGFQNPTDITHASLLLWHEKVYAKSKISSICRVLTDGRIV
ncbi:unnamed protein product [Mesocestoides corti]|uniref:Actin-related protein 2/3 complex subunit 5 n=1 Tax=Mesocestoides corti TaxID=53468 RepID=A0A0R3U2B6_MESCO|nr:unnamed protein product [Mesocestoides corti]